MALISEQYAKENANQHAKGDGYGERGYKHLEDILHVVRREGCKTALDYGCGKASLARRAKRVCEVAFANYDPAIEEYAGAPSPADLVVCTDVLEHVEPLCLNDVMAHLQELTQVAAYLQIATRPALRVLSDGRNAHLLIRDAYFWLDTLRRFFDITDMRVMPGHSVVFVCKPMGSVYK